MSRTARSIASAVTGATLLALAACGGGDAPTTPGGTTPPPPPVTPPPPTSTPIASVAVTPGSGAVYVGRTMALSATPRDAAGNPLGGRTIAWSSSADSVARVDAAGVVTGVAVGTATITATSEGQSARATVAVQLVPVASVAVTPATAALRVGDTLRLAATPRDSAGAALEGRTVRWSSSAPTVVAVDSVSGLLRAAGAGSAIVSATSEGRTGTASFAVAAPTVPVATVSIGGAARDTLEAWDVVPMQATLRDSLGRVLDGRAVRWRVSDPTIATIDSVGGQLTGRDRGTVTVTATSEGKVGTATRVVVIRYRSITAGTEHACDIASGGIVWCWGRNGQQGRIGLPELNEHARSTTPVRVGGELRFAQISTFGTTTCGVTRDAKAYCWGYNGWGALGSGSNAGQSITPVAVAGGHSFRSVTVGAAHACGVTTAGSLQCWGYNQSSEFGNGLTRSSDVPVLAAEGMPFATASAGNDFTCGVTVAGAGWCWGFSGAGNLGDGNRISFGNTVTRTPSAIVGGLTFRSVHASQSYACGLTTDGRGWCWGSGGARLGTGAGGETSTPQPIAGFTWKQLAPGSRHACGITTGDEIYCWGSNGYGQLGTDIGTNGSTRPVRAAGTLRGAEVSAANIATGSAAFTCAIAADRLTTYCWGKNDVGQLGNGTTTGADASNTTPTIVVGQKPLPATR